jgi:predicted transcriptional regulator of viral defense system
MKNGLSEIELRTLTFAQNRQIQQIRTGDLIRWLEITDVQERKVLSRLARRKLAVRVRRGLYLVPLKLPLGGQWSPGEAIALTVLMQDRNASYQICGPNAFHRYGWDEQVPNRVYAYNNRISGDRSVGLVDLTLIRVADKRLGDIELAKTPENIALRYSSRARSLVDAVYDWSRFNTLPRAFEWISGELTEGRVQIVDIVEATIKFGDQGTIRRIGYLLDELSTNQRIPTKLVERLEYALRPSTSTIPWVPTIAKRGRVNKRWGLIVNAKLPSIA